MQKEFNPTKYKNDFSKEKYDRVIITVPKGERERIKALAEAQNLSVNALYAKALAHFEQTALKR